MQRAVKTNPLVVDSMEASNQPDHPFRSNEEERDSSSSGDSDLSDSSDLDCDSDAADPSFRVLDEANHKLSALSIRKKPQSRIGKDHGEEGDDGVFEIADDMIKAGQVEKLKIDQCKTYLRKHGLRLSGCKAMLIQRIKEHQEILDGRGEAKYPLSSFVINCKGDACTSDIVLFEQNVYDMYNIASRSASGPPCGKRIVAGRIVKESYGAAKQQHTFTIEVLWSKGEKPLPPLHPLLIKGRNLYRLKTLRQRWQDENQRSRVLLEKHSRGSLARSDRETRMLEKEKRKLLCKGRVSRKDPKRKHVDTIHSTEPAKTDSLLVQQPSIAVNSQTMATQGKQYGKGTNEDPSTVAINMEVRIQNPKIPHPSSGQLNGNDTIMGQGGIHQKLPYYPQQDPIENRNSTFSLESRKMILQGGRPNNHAQKHESYYRGDQVPWELQPMRYGGNQQVQNFRRQPLTRMNNHGPARQPQSHGRQMCKYYAQGRCYFGNGCKFSHQRNEV